MFIKNHQHYCWWWVGGFPVEAFLACFQIVSTLWFKSAEYASEFCSTPTPLSTEYGGKACVVMTIGQLFQHKFSNKNSHLKGGGGRADQKIMKHVMEVLKNAGLFTSKEHP